MQPLTVHLRDIAPVHAFGDTAWPLLTASCSENIVEVAVNQSPSQSGPPLHVHSGEDEVFLVQEGEFEFSVGRDTYEVGPGTIVYGPRHVPHTFRCVSDEPGKLQVVITPGGFSRFFARCAEVFNGPSPDLGRVLQIGAEHGLRFLHPGEEETYRVPKAALSPRVIYPGGGERYEVAGAAIRVLLDSGQSGGQFSLVELNFQPGGGHPPHTHTAEDVLFLIQEGEVEISVGTEISTVGPGDLVWAPRSLPQGIKVTGNGPARMLTFFFPAGFEQYFPDLQTIILGRGFMPEIKRSLDERFGLQS